MLCFIIIFTSLWRLSTECETLQVTGAIIQNGVEGIYAINSRCTDIGNSVLYIQTEPSAGWGSVFYLYYYDTPEQWKGWVFSLYPCSDIPFVRSESKASSPPLVEELWEEFVGDNFVPNPEITVDCKGNIGITVVILIVTSGTIFIIVFIIMVYSYKNFKKKRDTTSTQNESFAQPHNHIFVPDLPSYNDVMNMTLNTTEACQHDFPTTCTTDLSSISIFPNPPAYETTQCFDNTYEVINNEASPPPYNLSTNISPISNIEQNSFVDNCVFIGTVNDSINANNHKANHNSGNVTALPPSYEETIH